MSATATPASVSARQMAILLWAVGMASALVWSESIGRYLQARYHLEPERWWMAVWPGADTAEAPSPVDGPSTGAAPPDAGAGRRAGLQAPSPAGSAPGRVAGPRPGTSAAPAAQAMGATPAAAGSSPAGSDDAQPLPPGQYLASVQNQRLAPGPQRVLFAGDSMMQGVAPLAIQALRKMHPDWVFHDLSRESTGLTVRRVFDWPSRIIEEIQTRKLTLVVIFLGPNDPWDIYEKRQVLRFPSAGWEARYAERVAEILRFAVAQEVRVIWMGLPSMRTERLHQGAVVQNRVFHAQALTHGTDYLATEPLIGLLSEPYRKTGGEDPDRSLSLRAEDGIHFTPTGQRILRDALVQHITQATPP